VHAAARRNPARFATIPPISRTPVLLISSVFQREVVERLHLPFPLLSDMNLALGQAIRLPAFKVAGMTLLKRMVLIIDDGVIAKVFYPVFPPDKSADEVVAWLRSGRG
jgi:peroxiredoxin